jgi:hypothetical protein
MHCEHVGSNNITTSKIPICSFGRGVINSSGSSWATTMGSSAEESKGVSSSTFEPLMVSEARWTLLEERLVFLNAKREHFKIESELNLALAAGRELRDG